MTILLNKVQFSYPEAPEKQVLNIPSWSLETGENVFIHGPSGCGKSTLLNLVSGILSPSSGEILILGERLESISQQKRDRFRANHIGYVFQQFNLIPYLSAVENIQLAQQFSKKPSSNSAPEIKDLLNKLNVSTEDRLKPCSKLSIGQQQRVAIARALINKPEILIADEPTSSLDQNNRDNFISELMSLTNEHNISLIFVSHDMTLAKNFDRVESLSEINSGVGANSCF